MVGHHSTTISDREQKDMLSKLRCPAHVCSQNNYSVLRGQREDCGLHGSHRSQPLSWILKMTQRREEGVNTKGYSLILKLGKSL